MEPSERERLARTIKSGRFAGVDDPRALPLLEELGPRWYRAACALVPPPLTASVAVVRDIAERFVDARRVLNALTDRYLFADRSRWFPPA